MEHHILIVEDSRTHRAMTEKILTEMGHKVTGAVSATKALEQLRAEPHGFSLIVMDWEMPGMNGLEAAKLIREREEQENWPRIPIIAFTANKRQGDFEKCIQAGMDDYLAKDIFLPKWRKMLEEKVNEWLPSEAKEETRISK